MKVVIEYSENSPEEKRKADFIDHLVKGLFDGRVAKVMEQEGPYTRLSITCVGGAHDDGI